MQLSIPIILGTAREGRESVHAAEFIHEQMENHDDIDPQLVDVRDHTFERTLPAWEEHEETAEWKEIAENADGFVVVTPEYNHGYPGELKQFMDGAYEQYAHKPVVISGVSAGNFGGARVVDLIKPTLIEYKMLPLRDALYFPNVGELFNDDGEMVEDKREENAERVADVTEELVAYAEGMQGVRKKLAEE